MKRASILRLVSACALSWIACCWVTEAQQTGVTVDWNTELAKAKSGIEKDPKSAFWHNQAGVAYNALGQFENAVKEIKSACALDESDPINYYTLYGFYKRKEMHSEQRQVLLDALERDPNNPLGRLNLPTFWKPKSNGQTPFVNTRQLSV